MLCPASPGPAEASFWSATALLVSSIPLRFLLGTCDPLPPTLPSALGSFSRRGPTSGIRPAVLNSCRV